MGELILMGTDVKNIVPSVETDTCFFSPWQTDFFLKKIYIKSLLLEKENISLLMNIHKSKFGDYVSWNSGPSGSIKECRTFLKEIFEKLRINGIIGIENASVNYYKNISEQEKIYVENGFYKEKKWATFLLDLNVEEDSIIKNMHSGLRRNIKRLLKNKYEVHSIEESKKILIDFVNIYNEGRMRSKLDFNRTLPLDLENLIECPTRKYFVLYIEGHPVACQGVCFNKDVAIEVVLAISNYALEHKIYAGDLLKWEIIKWCKVKNIKVYDFAGVAPQPANSKEIGIRNYKEKWGGDYIEYGIWRKSLSYKYDIWILLRKSKNLVYRLFKK